MANLHSVTLNDAFISCYGCEFPEQTTEAAEELRLLDAVFSEKIKEEKGDSKSDQDDTKLDAKNIQIVIRKIPYKVKDHRATTPNGNFFVDLRNYGRDFRIHEHILYVPKVSLRRAGAEEEQPDAKNSNFDVVKWLEADNAHTRKWLETVARTYRPKDAAKIITCVAEITKMFYEPLMPKSTFLNPDPRTVQGDHGEQQYRIRAGILFNEFVNVFAPFMHLLGTSCDNMFSCYRPRLSMKSGVSLTFRSMQVSVIQSITSMQELGIQSFFGVRRNDNDVVNEIFSVLRNGDYDNSVIEAVRMLQKVGMTSRYPLTNFIYACIHSGYIEGNHAACAFLEIASRVNIDKELEPQASPFLRDNQCNTLANIIQPILAILGVPKPLSRLVAEYALPIPSR